MTTTDSRTITHPRWCYGPGHCTAHLDAERAEPSFVWGNHQRHLSAFITIWGSKIALYGGGAAAVAVPGRGRRAVGAGRRVAPQMWNSAPRPLPEVGGR